MGYQFEPSGKLKIPTEAELASEAESPIIVYDEGTLEDGTPYWVYVDVQPTQYKAFMDKASQKAAIDYTEYGTIIKYGFEPSVPSDIKEEMKRDYGCDENFMAKFIAEFKSAQITFVKDHENKRLDDIVAMMKKKQSGS